MIRAGIGGWTFEPWRGLFYPQGLAQKRELEYASRALPTLEINGTFYRTQTPSTFRKWADETPDNFVFSIKAPRYATNKRILAEAGPAIERFLNSGLAELGSKLGPILWQFPPTKPFDAEDFAGFLALLPQQLDKLKLRHALEVRHPSFLTDQDARASERKDTKSKGSKKRAAPAARLTPDPAFIQLAQDANAAIVFTDATQYPSIDVPTADFVYARLMEARENEPKGYSEEELKTWNIRAQEWANRTRDVFIYFINGHKPHAPAAALALNSGIK